jgi:EpsD family peptidyl-prolyl cis-trans isomerase
MRLIFAGLLGLALISSAPPPAWAVSRQAPKTAASGETQVVARVGAREVTLSDLRTEMARLGLSMNDPEAERVALESIVNRALLASAARGQNLHRKPDAILRMQAAEEQALADLYLGLAAQPPEPGVDEIEDFIAANPSLFADRRVYEFSVLALPTAKFDDKAMAPLFDDAPDFRTLIAALESAKTEYAVSSAIQPSTAFPKPVREQLARYTVSDNIVIKSETQTQIMKITRATAEALPQSEWRSLARRILLEEKASARAEGLVRRLKSEAKIAYYRPSAAPAPAPKPAAQSTSKKTP